MLVDVELLVGGRQHFRLVNTVHAERLQNVRLDEVADATLGHHWDRDRLFDLEDQLGVAHTRHATLRANIRRHALQRHHRRGSGLLSNLRMLLVDDIHDDAALEHLRKVAFDPYGPGLSLHGRIASSRVPWQWRREFAPNWPGPINVF